MLCCALYSLSGAGRVIVMAIHQPRYAIFKLFDSLTLLSNGELVYHGPSVSALNYFSNLGKYIHCRIQDPVLQCIILMLKYGWIELMEPFMPSLYYHLETFQSGFNLVFRSINLGVL